MDNKSMSLLALLVIDFGYDALPIYGRTPLRHQIAWMNAITGLKNDEILEFIEKAKKERESILQEPKSEK